MQPNDDQYEGAQLRGLLREWPAPDLPPAVEQRVLRSCTDRRQSWWRFLFTGYIRVPVYIVYVLAVLLTAAGWRFVAHAPPGPCVAVVHHAPVNQAAAMPPQNPTRNPAMPRCNHPSPDGFC